MESELTGTNEYASRSRRRRFRWNETDESKFCSDLEPNTTKTANPRPKCSLHEALMDTVRKYVFFATDRTVVGKYTQQGSESIML